jgi:hypothetical protein
MVIHACRRRVEHMCGSAEGRCSIEWKWYTEHKMKKKEIEHRCISERGRESRGVHAETEQKNKKRKNM